jgi:DNA-binding NarL/FixJ family response regulator
MPNLRVLLVVPQPEEAFFLTDVLNEANEPQFREGNNQGFIEVTHAASWGETQALLSATPFPHIILLDPTLSDRPGAESLRSLQTLVPEIPVILLVNAADRSVAEKLLREGAQDFLIKRDIDCPPLTHAIRNAITRQHVLTAARAAAFTDALTGLPNRAAFTTLATRDRKLAERLERRWMILIAAPRTRGDLSFSFDAQRRDLEMVEMADYLRSTASPTDLMARIGPAQFALAVFDTEIESLEEAWIRVRTSAAERRIDVGASIFDASRPLSLEAMLQQAQDDMLPTRIPERSRTRIAGAA